MKKPTSAFPKLSEADVTAQVKGFLEARGWRAIRMNRGLVQGFSSVVQFGEPGQPDWQFIFYIRGCEIPAATVTLWVEMKAPGAKAWCRCATKRPKQRCTSCDQKRWKQSERARGGVVWTVDNIEFFTAEYQRTFSFLHTGELAIGQLEIPL